MLEQNTNGSAPSPGKTRVEDLAIFGGQPAFASPLYVGCPNIGDPERMLERMDSILRTRRLTNNGPFVREFESRICKLTGAAHCIAVCNATVGLQLAIRAIGLSGEVIVPAFTFVATAHSLQFQEITPVFCDVDSRTHNIDVQDAERRITSRTTGIIGVHLWGRPADVEGLSKLAAKHNLRLIFDSAHAFGCSHKGRLIGAFGDAEVFSFHGTKFINAFEGGAVVTNNDVLADRLRLMRNFGFADYDDVVCVGSNAKMSEASAAMGLTSLESIDKFVEANRSNYDAYRRCLEEIPGISLCSYEAGQTSNYQYIVLEIDEAVLGLTRDQLKDILWTENVLARRYFYPGCHRMQPYRSDPRFVGVSLPRTEQLCSQVLVLPTGTAVCADDIRQIASLISFAAGHAVLLRERLTARGRASAA